MLSTIINRRLILDPLILAHKKRQPPQIYLVNFILPLQQGSSMLEQMFRLPFGSITLMFLVLLSHTLHFSEHVVSFGHLGPCHEARGACLGIVVGAS
jgi:hypothetical protein